MKANYHTHTARCGHATGTDEDYVLAAIEQGFDELGFSDHVPWPYQDGYTHPSVRMRVDQMPGYLNSVRALAAQYKDKIHILTGFECEYFPDYMNWLADMRAENHLDYLILGNHFDHDDEYGMYFGNIHTAAQLRRYVDSAVKGLETGLFSYLAHPDLFMRRWISRWNTPCTTAFSRPSRTEGATPTRISLKSCVRRGCACSSAWMRTSRRKSATRRSGSWPRASWSRSARCLRITSACE